MPLTLLNNNNAGGFSLINQNNQGEFSFILSGSEVPITTTTTTTTTSTTTTTTTVPTTTTTTTTSTTTTTTTVAGSDQLRAQLTASLAAYDAASVGNWVKITSTEYNKIATNVAGATKKGNTDLQVNTRDVLTSYSNSWLAFGTTGNPSFQINTGEYVIAMITEAWNQSGGTSQLSYMTTFTGSVVANIGGTAGPSSGGVRDYFVRKAPTDAAAQTRYPVLYMTVSPNAVNNWSGFRSTNSGSSWTSLPNNQLPKIQLITTSTKSW